MQFSGLVHDRLATIAAFAYSQQALEQLRAKAFVGEWKMLAKFLEEIPTQRATEALMELALYFRSLDDSERLTELWKASYPQIGPPVLGMLHVKNGRPDFLRPRDMANKVIHAKSIEWTFEPEPRAICIGSDSEKWTRAEINVRSLIALGGLLGSAT